MASDQSFVDYIVDQLSAAGHISARKMFGEYGLYCNDKIVGLICDNTLFIKPSPRSNDFAAQCEQAPAYPGGKPYLKVSEEYLEDREWLSLAIQKTAESLPAPKSKKK